MCYQIQCIMKPNYVLHQNPVKTGEVRISHKELGKAVVCFITCMHNYFIVPFCLSDAVLFFNSRTMN